MNLTTTKLSGYAISCGFQSETERLELILTAMEKDEAAVESWLDNDGSAAGLLAIIQRKRRVRPTQEEA